MKLDLNNTPIIRIDSNNNASFYESIIEACKDERDNYNPYEIEIAILSDLTYRGYTWLTVQY